MTLNERVISSALDRYFRSRGLAPIGKFDVFDHIDDSNERTFVIDFAIGPTATKGRRTPAVESDDLSRFRQEGPPIDRVVDDLLQTCDFPSDEDCQHGWRRQENPNPMVGLAVEIENAKSKYFLGSLLAASCTGRWGLLIAPDSAETNHWIHTVRRMVYKGSSSPIPSNIIIFKWNRLETHISQRICAQQPIAPADAARRR